MYQSIKTFISWAASLSRSPGCKVIERSLQSGSSRTCEKSRPSHQRHRSFLWDQRKDQPSPLLTGTASLSTRPAKHLPAEMILNCLSSQLLIFFECQRWQHELDMRANHMGLTTRCGFMARLWALKMDSLAPVLSLLLVGCVSSDKQRKFQSLKWSQVCFLDYKMGITLPVAWTRHICGYSTNT